jgi:hypothetical protein
MKSNTVPSPLRAPPLRRGFSGFLSKTIFGARSDILFEEKKIPKKFQEIYLFQENFEFTKKKFSLKLQKMKIIIGKR